MAASILLLLAVGLGHGMLTILALNMSHGFGFNARWMDRAVLAILAVVGALALATAWSVLGVAWVDWPLPARAYSLACLATAFVGLPMVTWTRSRRRTPEGIAFAESRVVDIAAGRGRDTLIGPSGRSSLLRVPGNDAFRLRLVDCSATIPTLPDSLDGLSILHLSDLHFSPAYARTFFEDVIGHAAAWCPEPDLVFITGDFLDHDSATEWVVPLLSGLRGRLGQFAVLGNHDFRHDFRTLRRRLRDSGFRVLEGRWDVIEAGDDRVAIGGSCHPWGKDLFRRPMPCADLNLVLSHSPDEVYRGARLGVDAMFSGHNHGGQVRLPVIGPVLMPSRYSRRLDREFFRVGPTLLHVSQGIGAKDPLRLGCLPEVTRIVLRSAARPAMAEVEDDGSIVSLAGS